MTDHKENRRPPGLDIKANEETRQKSLRELCTRHRESLKDRDPYELARLAAMRLERAADGSYTLTGEHLSEEYKISWPSLKVTDQEAKPALAQTEALWLHYLDRADGQPLSGRWVNLSEIGGLFYQQAFQGYCGDMLAKHWGSDLEGLRKKCLAKGGWAMPRPGDLAFEWRALPRMPLCICYRLPAGTKEAWATILFDAAADHYVAADVAAIVGKKLADLLVL